jgi:hypothetical protein
VCKRLAPGVFAKGEVKICYTTCCADTVSLVWQCPRQNRVHNQCVTGDQVLGDSVIRFHAASSR